MTVAGIEGIHAWTPPGATEPAIELGRTHDDKGEPVWPRFALQRITGLASTGDPEDNRDAPPGRSGEIARLSQRRGKTVVYEGELRCRTLIELREAEGVFRAAFHALNSQGRMDVSWHELNTEFEDEPPKFYEARALTAEIVDKQDTTQWDRFFVVALRLGDARYFDEESEVHSDEIEDTNTTYDFGGPITLPANTRGPVLDLELPASEDAIDIILRNVTTGKTLAINLPEDWDGDDLTLDWFRRKITDQAGADRSALLDAEDNELWTTPLPFPVGPTVVQIEAATTVKTLTATPGSVSSDTSIGTGAWASTSDAKTSNDKYASTLALKAGAISHYLSAGSFGLAVPAGSEIVGIRADVECVNAIPATKVIDYAVRLKKGSEIGATNKAAMTALAMTDTVRSYGGLADLWGTTWTPSEINASTFAVMFAVQHSEGSETGAAVDAVSVTVAYNPPYSAKATLRWDKAYF